MSRVFALLLLLLSATFLHSVRGLQFIPDTPSPFTSASKDAAKYVITISDKVEENPSSAGRYVVMADARGTPYKCQLPDGTSGLAAAPATIEDDEPVRSPQDLLDSLEGMCLYRQDGSWTYEICYKQHVRQMHQSTKEEHSCGAYKEPEEEAASEEGDAAAGELGAGVKIDRSTVGPALPYLSHVFTGGADCLLTRRPRTSEVRFTCMEEGGQNIVTSVREFPTCNYVFIVSTPFLCKHPVFRPKVDLVQAINCTLLHARDAPVTASGGTGVEGVTESSGEPLGLQHGAAGATVELEELAVEVGAGGGDGSVRADGTVAEEGGHGGVYEGEAEDEMDEALVERVQQSFVEEVEEAEQAPPLQDAPFHEEL